MYEPFQSWHQLMDHISAGYKLFYQAPLDHQPAIVQATVRKDGRIRVMPVFTDADPFTADIGHLSRFRRYVGRQ